MNCSNCKAAIVDESLGFCTECGESFGVIANAHGGVGELEPEADGGYDDGGYADEGYANEGYANEGYDEGQGWQDAPPRGPTPSEQLEQLGAKVFGPVGAVARQVGDVFQSVLDDPRLRGLLPGGSLTLLGLGCVALALLLSALPFLPGVGLGGTLVMGVLGVIAGLNEWHYLAELEPQEGRPVWPFPEALRALPRELWEPRTSRLFALLTCTYALWMLGVGFLSLVWLLAAVLIGYEQGQRFFLEPLDQGPAHAFTVGKRHRWVVVGVVLCTLSLLMPWTRLSARSFQSGFELPLSPLTQALLLLLACSTLKRKSLEGLHPLLLALSAVWLTMWGLLMMYVYCVGPWVYLFGLLLIDAVIGFHLVQLTRGPSHPPGSEHERASDLDYPR